MSDCEDGSGLTRAVLRWRVPSMDFFRFLERFSRGIEKVAGVLLGLVTVLVVVSSLGRYVFALPVPDAFDLSRFLIGAAIMWGFASVGYRGSHIKVDLFVEMIPARLRRVCDLFAWLVLGVFTVLLFWKMSGRAASAYASGEATFDLRLPAWPMIVLIAAGVGVSIITIGARILLIGAGQGELDSHETIETSSDTTRPTDEQR